MTFKLPDFTNSYCHIIMACGSIKSKSQKALELLESHPGPFRCRYRVGASDSWLLVMLGGGDDKRHFHMEAMSEHGASIQGLNQENCDIDEVQELLRPMLGRRIEVALNGLFMVPVGKVPKKSLVQPRITKEGKTRIKTMAVYLEIEGAPVPGLTWSLIGDSTVRVDLVTRLAGKIEEEYLDWFFKLLNSAFRAYVLGESPDEPLGKQAGLR